MTLENVVAQLVHKIERRFYGKYRGFVVDNADPEKLGRLKVKIPSVLGSEVVTGWAMPCVPYGGEMNQGMLFIPEVSAGVWVEFEEGDLEFPIWVGTFWSKPGGESELPRANDPGGEEGGVQDQPTRKIIKTVKGHTIQFEDKDDEEMVTIVEAKNNHVITMNKDGIKISDGSNGHTFVLDNSGIDISDGVNGNNKILMDQSGLTVQDKNGNIIIMDASSGYPAGPGIKLNDGGDRICLEGLIDWLVTHQHVGNMGAPTPLFPADMAKLMVSNYKPGAQILSDSVKAK